MVTVVLSNKIFQRKQSSQFCISEMQNNKWKARVNNRWVAKGLSRFFKLCKISFETNRFTQSKQSGSSSRQKTCMRWILIHLNSEFHAMLSWTLLDMLGRLNEEKKSSWPNYLLPIAWTLMWNLQLRVTAITFFSRSLFPYFFLHAYRKVSYDELTQWKQYHQCR